MKEGDRILILPSEELAGMSLMELAFGTGTIVEICRNKMGIYGAWVEIDEEPYLDEKEWFIPIESIGL